MIELRKFSWMIKKELLSLKRENNEVFFFTYDTAILTDEVLNKLRDERIPLKWER